MKYHVELKREIYASCKVDAKSKKEAEEKVFKGWYDDIECDDEDASSMGFDISLWDIESIKPIRPKKRKRR